MAPLHRLQKLLIGAILLNCLYPAGPFSVTVAHAAAAKPSEPLTAAAHGSPPSAPGAAVAASAHAAPPDVDPARVRQALGAGDHLFVENAGQWHARARFQVRGTGIFVSEDALWLTLREPVEPLTETRGVHLRLSFVGANPDAYVEGFDPVETTLSYFAGTPSQWHSAVPVYRGVRYVDLYPGIDLELRGPDGHWMWTLVVRDPRYLDDVRLRVQGGRHLALTDGQLRVGLGWDDLALPLLQLTGAQPPANPTALGEVVSAPFAAPGAQALAQVVLPLEFFTYFHSTLLGGSSATGGAYQEGANAIDVDRDGNVYVAGTTPSTDFPITPGAYHSPIQAAIKANVFVSKFDPTLSHLEYSVILASDTAVGGFEDYGLGLAVNHESGEAFVVGATAYGASFPTTTNRAQKYGGGLTDGFLTGISAAGDSLVYSTYIGGTGVDQARAVAIGADDAIYVTGVSASACNPLPPQPPPPPEHSCFITAGAYDTTQGGSYNGDAFLAKFVPNGGGDWLVYGTYYGTSGHEEGWGIAVDPAGRAILVGIAQANGLATPGGFQTTFSGGNRDGFWRSSTLRGTGPMT